MDVLQRSPIKGRPSLDDDTDVSWMAQDGKPQPSPNVTNITAEYGSPSSPIWQAGRVDPLPSSPAWQAQERHGPVEPPVVAMQTPAWVQPALSGMAEKIANAIIEVLGDGREQHRPIEAGVRTFGSPFLHG